ncbi:MAG: DUF551 domain-containing protein [Lutibacter sp.]|jgi:hypothetical protein
MELIALQKIQKQIEDLRIEQFHGLSIETMDTKLHSIEMEVFKLMDKVCEGKADGTSEKDLRVCEVIASAWISVKERLPEFNTLVLVNCSVYGRFLASYEFIGEFQGEKYGNWRHNEELGILPPTHWMSIPELPN